MNHDLAVPRSELSIRATRASGPGGQHVNKTATRVEVTWNVETSPSISDEQRARLINRLAPRMTEAGEIRVVASDTRSQLQNRELAESRLAGIIRRALAVPKQRKPTSPSRAAKAARLIQKRHRSDTKRERRQDADE